MSKKAHLGRQKKKLRNSTLGENHNSSKFPWKF